MCYCVGEVMVFDDVGMDVLDDFLDVFLFGLLGDGV